MLFRTNSITNTYTNRRKEYSRPRVDGAGAGGVRVGAASGSMAMAELVVGEGGRKLQFFAHGYLRFMYSTLHFPSPYVLVGLAALASPRSL